MLEPDLLGKGAAVIEARGEGWTMVLGEKCGAVRTHTGGCSERRQKKLVFCHVEILSLQ